MTTTASALLLAAALAAPAADQSFKEPDRAKLLAAMDAKAAHYGDLSRKIWEYSEVGYKETKSAAAHVAELKAAGFEVQEGVAGIPTAFVASWGGGQPVIGMMAEYDALPGLSQQDIPEKKARVEGDPGHGCGHNLLGTGAVFAAIGVKDELAARKIPGTIRLYGTPAEEGGGGKIYMARAGLIKDVDVMLAWHPGDRNEASVGTTLANITAKFRFRGQAAHAAGNPDKGRSSLDAVMLTGMGIEFLREHVPQETRMHYIITKGGEAPNVVPAFAETYVYARHSHMPTLDGIWERIVKIAQAGALATDTVMEMKLINSVYNSLPNDALAALLDKNLRRVGGLRYSPEETSFASTMAASFTASEDRLPLGSEAEIQTLKRTVESSSTDLGDVSWLVPTSELSTATYVPGTPAHSWQSAACAGMSIGRKGMVVAAKTLALSAMDLFTDPSLVKAARDSFDKRRAGYEYKSRVPADQKPPLNYRDK
ncbi:MAG: amidohydrolase [Vicinamibacteria bacterium]|nr:amidohydrolase [Vicinamibacteria bacterium]